MRATSACFVVFCGVFAACGGAMRTGKGSLNIEDAELPYRVLERGGREINEATFRKALGAARAVCIGESHTNPHDHWAQLTLSHWLIRNNELGGTATAIGMEMFQSPFQAVLDDYTDGRIDEAALLSRSGWEERWGYDFGLYRPIVNLAKNGKARLLALNLSNELKKKVSKNGLEKLSEEDRAKLPDVDLDNKAHRAWWDDIMDSMSGHGGHPGGGGGDEEGKSDEDKARSRARSDRSYSVQVLWDETMADNAARWLSGGKPRQVIIIAGNGHCHDSGIVARLKRRGVNDAISIRPLVDDKSGELSQMVAAPENDFLFVMTAAKP